MSTEHSANTPSSPEDNNGDSPYSDTQSEHNDDKSMRYLTFNEERNVQHASNPFFHGGFEDLADDTTMFMLDNSQMADGFSTPQNMPSSPRIPFAQNVPDEFLGGAEERQVQASQQASHNLMSLDFGNHFSHTAGQLLNFGNMFMNNGQQAQTSVSPRPDIVKPDVNFASLGANPQTLNNLSVQQQGQAQMTNQTQGLWSGVNHFLFSNPFPQAIPTLAKNFTEYLSHSAVGGLASHFTLGGATNAQPHQPGTHIKELNSSGGAADIPSMTGETSMSTTIPNELDYRDLGMIDSAVKMEDVEAYFDGNLQIRVLGVPASGAKSRVETQIKLCIQLVTDKGEKVPLWSHLRLPEYMVARDRLRKPGISGSLNTGGFANMDGSDIPENKLLNLEATVICATQPTKKVLMCLGCVQRERKRQQRRREMKLAKGNLSGAEESPTQASTGDNSGEMEVEDDQESLALDQRKILMFNCPDIVDFSSGDTILPTRITCYCRHHSEKLGFCILFQMKDHNSNVIATGMSPPILITDDHKSTKGKQNAGRKKPRTERDRPTPYFAPQEAMAIATEMLKNNNEGSERLVEPKIEPEPSVMPDAGTNIAANQGQYEERTSGFGSHQFKFIKSSLQPSTFKGTMPQVSEGGQPHSLFNFGSFQTKASMNQAQEKQLNGPSASNEQGGSQPSQPASLTTTASQPAIQPLIFNNSVPSFPTTANYQQNPNIAAHQASSRRRQPPPSFTTFHAQRHDTNTSGSTQHQETASVPALQRLIPSEGPTYGGVEVTVLGAGFYSGLTCMFGENAALPTNCWSPNTLVCLLPPTTTAGPVVVSFKEHPLLLEGQDVVLFTYFDESDRALMALALQVVGLKMTGKLEDARQIAMRIVQGDNNTHGTSGAQQRGSQPNGGRKASTKADLTSPSPSFECLGKDLIPATSTEFEQHIMQVLAAVDTFGTSFDFDVDLQNNSGHTMLHLASMCGYKALCQQLLRYGAQPNPQDRNGLTPLHFAAWTGRKEVVEMLLSVGADPTIRTYFGDTPARMAHLAGHHEMPLDVDESDGITSETEDLSYEASSEASEEESVCSIANDPDPQWDSDKSSLFSESSGEDGDTVDELEHYDSYGSVAELESDDDSSLSETSIQELGSVPRSWPQDAAKKFIHWMDPVMPNLRKSPTRAAEVIDVIEAGNPNVLIKPDEELEGEQRFLGGQISELASVCWRILHMW